MPYYAYILECADGTYYIGSTDNLYARVAEHNEGRGASYTRSRLPARLVYHEDFENRSLAMKREWELKKLNREQKKRMVEGFGGK